MGEPFGNQNISGVLACWFDDHQPNSAQARLDQIIAGTTGGAQPAAQSGRLALPAPAAAAEQMAPSSAAREATSNLFDLIEAVSDRQAPAQSKQAAASRAPVQPCLPVEALPRMSVHQMVTEICQSHDSPLYQWLKRNRLDNEFDERTHSVEQRWAPDGTYCTVRRTANGYTHTIVLKEHNSKTTQRVTAPDGTVLLHISASGALIEANRQPVLMSA